MSNILIVKNPKENREVCRFFLIRFTSCVAVLSLQDIKLKRGYGKKDLIMRSLVDNAILCIPKSPSVNYL